MVQAAGHRCVIYTGSWFWKGRLGDPDLGAAHAAMGQQRYDGRPSLATQGSGTAAGRGAHRQAVPGHQHRTSASALI